MRLLGWALVACTTVQRARTWPVEAPITTTEWFAPQEVVPGRPTDGWPKAPSDAIPAEDLEAVRAYAADRRTVGLIVLSRGRVALEWYAPGADAATRVNGMGLTATVTALAWGVLQGDQLLPREDRPIAESVFPEWQKDPIRSLITWRDLLEHTSGLAVALPEDGAPVYFGAALADAVLAVPAERAPGYAYRANLADTQLLALAVERVTEQRLATVLSDRLWRPMGASDAALWLDRKDGTAHASCCLLATTRDWARVGQLLLNGGRVGQTQVVPRDYVARMTMPSRHNPDFGWHLWRGDDGPGSARAKERGAPFVEKALFWMDGEGAQRVYVMPRAGIVAVRVGDPPADWDDAFVVNTLARGRHE